MNHSVLASKVNARYNLSPNIDLTKNTCIDSCVKKPTNGLIFSKDAIILA